jgi:hypothetical protein
MFTWLIDAVLSTIPAWMWLAGAGAGLVAFFFASIFSHFPPLKPYMMFVKPLGGIAALVCVFMYGGSGVQAMWEEKVRVAQEAADKKAVEAADLNKKLSDERKKKSEVRVEYRDRVRTEIQVQKEFIDKDCKIDPKVPELLNKSAANPEKAK